MDPLVRPPARGHAGRSSASSAAARTRTTTARNGGGRATVTSADDGWFPAGYAADDGAALHFVGTEFREVLAVREGATAYRVEPGSRRPSEARSL